MTVRLEAVHQSGGAAVADRVVVEPQRAERPVGREHCAERGGAAVGDRVRAQVERHEREVDAQLVWVCVVEHVEGEGKHVGGEM